MNIVKAILQKKEEEVKNVSMLSRGCCLKHLHRNQYDTPKNHLKEIHMIYNNACYHESITLQQIYRPVNFIKPINSHMNHLHCFKNKFVMHFFEWLHMVMKVYITL